MSSVSADYQATCDSSQSDASQSDASQDTASQESLSHSVVGEFILFPNTCSLVKPRIRVARGETI